MCTLCVSAVGYPGGVEMCEELSGLQPTRIYCGQQEMPMEEVGSLSLVVFESRGDVALRAMADGHGEMGWTYCRSLFQP